MVRILFVAAVTILIHSTAFAAGALGDCRRTPSIVDANSNYPGHKAINTSNDLTQPPGKAERSLGQIVYLSGVVTDESCVPVSDAHIEIWQTDTQAVYRLAKPEELANPYPIFTGSGTAVTDNLGNYRFVTIFPGAYQNRAPHIHVKISHPDFPTLTTEIYFSGDARNAGDKSLKTVRAGERELLMAQVRPRSGKDGVDAVFNIALKGKNKYRRY